MMKVYQGDSIVPDDNEPMTFVEVEPDHYLEINLPYTTNLDNSLKQMLRAWVRKVKKEEQAENFWHMRIRSRYFRQIRQVPNLRLVGEF